MSITAITIDDKNCEAVVEWLHQFFVLDYIPNAMCVTELVVKSTKGALRQLNLYIPYRIMDVNDRCFSLLDDKNKMYYQEDSYSIIERSKDGMNGVILFDHKETKIHRINLHVEGTPIGSKLTIEFREPICMNERCGIRLFYDCKDLSIFSSSNTYAITLYYLNSPEAVYIGISETIKVKKLFIWMFFPFETKNIFNIAPSFWQMRTIPKIKKDALKVFYGDRNDEIWSKLPRKVGMWQRGMHEPDKDLTEDKWPNIIYNCEYQISEKEEIVDESYLSSFAIVWSSEHPDGKPIGKEEYNNFIKNKSSYRIFTIDEGEYDRDRVGTVYFDDASVSTQTEVIGDKRDKKDLTALEYRILVYTLKNQGFPGEVFNLIEKCWFDSQTANEMREIKEKEAKGKVGERTFSESTSKYRKNIALLSNLLFKQFGVKLVTKRTGKYRLDPSVPKYCVLEIIRT